MPVVGEFHSVYWSVSDTAVPVPPGPSRGGYPGWQSGPNSIVIGVGFGGIAPWFERAWAALRWCLRWWPRLYRLDAEQRRVMEHVVDALESPHYRVAQTAVRGTATTLRFNRPEAWIHLGRALKAAPGPAENTFRHLEACRRLQASIAEIGSTLTNPQLHLTVELAYHGFAVKGR